MIHVPLNPQRISQGLRNGYWRVKVISETTSTQSEIFNFFSPIQDGDLLVAEFQNSGRGRLDRKFVAPPMRALLFSTFLKPSRNISEWGWLPLIIGLSVAESLTELTGKKFSTKWPNDVLYEGKKVCGILCESSHGGVIAGVGINVNFDQSELPVKNATAVNLISGKLYERDQVLIEVLNRIKMNLEIWNKNLTNSLPENYLKFSATLNNSVRIDLGNGNAVTAKAIGISEAGELELDNGTAVSIGDVTHLR
ncbi:MAG: biotin--[acetyl-CoA-carboxylase] ligase [Acidobacteria bacterium]|nr:biotin--[acetyl-CoA-carboxylase] ligase [Acidobacteriota bacterium]